MSASIDPRLELLLRAAINVADTAFVHQRLVSRTALHQPMRCTGPCIEQRWGRTRRVTARSGQ